MLCYDLCRNNHQLAEKGEKQNWSNLFWMNFSYGIFSVAAPQKQHRTKKKTFNKTDLGNCNGRSKYFHSLRVKLNKSSPTTTKIWIKKANTNDYTSILRVRDYQCDFDFSSAMDTAVWPKLFLLYKCMRRIFSLSILHSTFVMNLTAS